MLLANRGDGDWEFSTDYSNVGDMGDLNKRIFIITIRAKIYFEWIYK